MLVVGIAAAVYWKRRVGAIWLCVVGYVALCVAAMITTRSGADTADELGQTLRYVADCAIVVAIALALTARAPRRAGRVAPRAVPTVAGVLAAVFVALSTVSTLAFARSWRDNPTTDYLDTARAELAAHRDVPLLDQPVSIWVLLPVTFPNNSAARIFAPLRDRPEFAASTPELRALDDQGRLVQASVTWTRSIPQGPDPDCGFRVSEPTSVPLDGPLMQWDWTAQLNYFADRDGTVEVGLPGGDPVAVPLEAGLHQVYVRLAGQGSELQLRPLTSGLSMCLGAGPVGAVVPGQAPVSSPANSRDGG
ncbi:MAG: hypothetical protein ICV72_11890 [Aldersonia sp.]|nr:hypothetical protein [Aldersonia sp.]